MTGTSEHGAVNIFSDIGKRWTKVSTLEPSTGAIKMCEEPESYIEDAYGRNRPISSTIT